MLIESGAVEVFRAGLVGRGYRPAVLPIDVGWHDRAERGPQAALRVEAIGHPVDAMVSVPGSKSLTNRALLCAPWPRGPPRSTTPSWPTTPGPCAALAALGARVEVDDGDGGRPGHRDGTGGRLRPGPLALDMRLSGTTSRFLLPVVAVRRRPLPGRRRPAAAGPADGPVLDGVATLGATVEAHGEPGHLPVTITAPAGRWAATWPSPVTRRASTSAGCCWPAPGARRRPDHGDHAARVPPVRRPHGGRHGRVRRHGDGGGGGPGRRARPDRAAGRVPGRRLPGRARRLSGLVPAGRGRPARRAGHRRGARGGHPPGRRPVRRPARRHGRVGHPHGRRHDRDGRAGALGRWARSTCGTCPTWPRPSLPVAVFADGPTRCGGGADPGPRDRPHRGRGRRAAPGGHPGRGASRRFRRAPRHAARPASRPTTTTAWR